MCVKSWDWESSQQAWEQALSLIHDDATWEAIEFFVPLIDASELDAADIDYRAVEPVGEPQTLRVTSAMAAGMTNWQSMGYVGRCSDDRGLRDALDRLGVDHLRYPCFEYRHQGFKLARPSAET
jgi:hypothetical protein